MIKPLHDFVVVKSITNKDTTESGIIVTEAVTTVEEGIVINVGPGIYDSKGTFITTTIVLGDMITFESQAGIRFDHEGEELIMMRESEVLALLADE